MSVAKKNRRLGSKLVRLNDRTIAALDKLRRTALLHYGSYDQLIHELALQVGIPRRPELPSQPVAYVPARAGVRTLGTQSPRRDAAGSR